jgi:hypothetical protein
MYRCTVIQVEDLSAVRWGVVDLVLTDQCWVQFCVLEGVAHCAGSADMAVTSTGCLILLTLGHPDLG